MQLITFLMCCKVSNRIEFSRLHNCGMKFATHVQSKQTFMTVFVIEGLSLLIHTTSEVFDVGVNV